ncbi:MAG: molybdopterin-dependent oxidoreductase [Myxococcales bacterium]|nr:molybdopterin-dependent oxidoreductase [Myxococcales bacterium]
MTRRRTPPPISRRAALSALGALGAAGAAAGCKRGWIPPEDQATSRAVAKPYVPGAEAYGTYEERWFQSSCGQCSAGCGIRVRVVEGRAVRVEGNPDNPLNQGGIGPRGLAAVQGLYDADRLTGPLARVGGKLVPVSWDDALGELGAALTDLRGRGEPERLLVWCGLERGMMHDLLARFCQAYGTPNFIDGRPGRTGVLAQAMAATIGVGESPVYGWEDASTILSLEAGLLEDSCQSVYFTRVAADRRRSQRRARLIHAGPVLDLSAYNADEWIRITPGTSGALALGIAAVLLREFPAETALPQDLTDGGAAWQAFVAGFTPARVEAVTGVEPRTLERLARDLWAQRPALVVVDERSVAYANGLDTALAALALNAVLGGFWSQRGGVRAAPVAPLRDWPELALDDVARAGLARARLDGAGAYRWAGSVHETLPDAIERAGAAAPAIALLHHANPAYARQQPARWRQALARIPKIVSFSPYRDETVEELAHLVLPDHTFLERWELVVPAPALDRALIGARVPAIVPLHDTRASGDVVLDLARRIGAPVADGFAWSTYREALEARLHGLRERNRGNVRALSHRDFVHQLLEVGFWVDEPPEPTPPPRVAVHASYAEPTWFGDPERYPLGLIAYRPLGYAEGGGANLPWLRNLRQRPGDKPWSFVARVHPTSAPGLHDGARVTLESEWGALAIELRLDRWTAPGYIAVPMGGGHDGFGRWARGYGANVLGLMRPGPAPVSGANVLCATRVRIAPPGGGAA